MMRFFSILIFCMVTAGVGASKKAITEEGDTVVLHDDGTWVYENAKVKQETVLEMNPGTFNNHADSAFKLQSQKTNAAFSINPEKWAFKKNDQVNDAAEYSFSLKGSDLYGMAITEELEIGVELLTDVALQNARDAASDIKVIKKEYRIVNGQKVIYMEMEGTIQGIKFTYLGLYHSDASGSTQYLTYTGSNLVSKYKSDIDVFLNGLTTH